MSECGAEPEASAAESATAADVNTDGAVTKEADPETGTSQNQPAAQSAVDGEHTCSECGMSFERRYSLIMHTLKHEKARGYKCSVSIGVCQHVTFHC